MLHQKNSFGLLDYLRMFLKRGVRLPTYYFINAHLFDLIHKTDTHAWLSKDFYIEKPNNINNGSLYMTSWTNEIKRSFNYLYNSNLLDIPYVFIDIGCGKGKACLTWRLLEKKFLRHFNRIIGIDYYEPLINIAKNNFINLFKNDGEFYFTDATNFNYSIFPSRLIIYLYNPFDESILEKVLEKLPTCTIIIYNNPVHLFLFDDFRFKEIYCHKGWHVNLNTNIFIKI